MLIASLAGCAQYHLQGRVIEGTQSQVLIVNQNDPRLNQTDAAGVAADDDAQGLGDVRILITQAPQSLDRKQVGQGVTDGKGDFSIPITSFGAGFLEYQMWIVAHRKAHTPAQRIMQLPSRDKRLLIIMAPGRDQPLTQDFLQNTLEMGKPFMNE